MTAPARLVLVGFGKIARDQHLPAVAGDPRFTLAGVVDPGGAPDGLPHAQSLEAFLAAGHAFDAVALCTPPQVRSSLAQRAIAAGKHVLLEKPPAIHAADVAPLEVLASRAGVTLFAAWHSRHAAGVAPARRWLAQHRPAAGRILWREDVQVWHPGQAWIWQAGGYGVFDPGINALSILTALHPGPWSVAEARLQTPRNAAMPARADLVLRSDDGLQVSAAFDFLHQGPPQWDLELTTGAGALGLSHGGAQLAIDGAPVEVEPHGEYPALYARFAGLIAAGASDVDVAPLRLVEEALARGEVTPIEPIAI